MAIETKAALTSPTPSSTFTSTSVTFDWTTATGATWYLLHLGSTGVGSSNLDSSGKITGTTVTFNGLPANGETIYARLYTYYGTAYVSIDYTYTAE